ncbi:hypothetical protein MASR2M15_08810 [Anaerolineales bacterium]
MRINYEYAGEKVALDVERQKDGSFIITHEDQVIRVDAVDVQGAAIQFRQEDGRQKTIWVAGDDKNRFVHHEQVNLQVSLADTNRRKSSLENDHDLSAQMPAQITNLHVQVGDTVKMGDKLISLEAMKMEMQILAPYAGLVLHLHAAVGDVVERGQRLIELEKSEPE